MERFEPYHGGNDSLRALHELDIQDKHTGIIVVATPTTIDFNLAYQIDGSQAAGHFDVVRRLEFSEGTSLAGHGVFETLENLVKLVDGIIEAFASLVNERVV